MYASVYLCILMSAYVYLCIPISTLMHMYASVCKTSSSQQFAYLRIHKYTYVCTPILMFTQNNTLHTYVRTTSPFNTVYAYVCISMSICMYLHLSTYTTTPIRRLHIAQFNDNLALLSFPALSTLPYTHPHTLFQMTTYTYPYTLFQMAISSSHPRHKHSCTPFRLRKSSVSDGYLIFLIVNTPRRPVDQQRDMRHHVLYLHVHTHTHTHTETETQTQTQTQTQTHAHTHTRTHKHTHIYIYIYVHTHTHTHTHMHTYAHMHTHRSYKE